MTCPRRAITLGDHNAGVGGKIEIDEAAAVARTAAMGFLNTAKVGDNNEAVGPRPAASQRQRDDCTLWKQCCVERSGWWACGLPCRITHERASFGDAMVRHVVRVLRPLASSRQMAFAAEGQNASSRTARAIKLQRRSESSVQPVQRSHGGYECTPCDRSVL